VSLIFDTARRYGMAIASGSPVPVETKDWDSLSTFVERSQSRTSECSPSSSTSPLTSW
jgi:hypothetical protein